MKLNVRRFLTGMLSVAAALPLAAALTTTGERQLAFATYQDIEPTVLIQNRSGVEHQVAAWMEFTNNGTPNPPTQMKYNHFAAGNATIGSLPLLAGHSGGYADPIMAQNTSNVAPLQRIYMTGVAHNGTFTDTSTVVRWYSDNGGKTWSSAMAVHQYVGPQATRFIDKPTVAVSPGGTSAGYVYVLWTDRISANNTLTYQLMLKVSTDGGATFNGPFTVGAATANLPVAQVLVDSNGDVYVVSSRWQTGTDELRVAKASPYNPASGTMTFGADVVSAVGNMRHGGTQWVPCGTNCTVRALSVLMAKLDPIRRRIGVVWHEQNASGGTVVQFRPISISGSSPVWQTGVTLPWNGGHDMQPALDFDTNGGFLVPFYAMGMNVGTYYQVARYIYFSGSTPIVEDASSSVHVLTWNLNDVKNYPADPQGGRLLGDYRDVYFSNGSFKSVGIQVQTYGNPYIWTTTRN